MRLGLFGVFIAAWLLQYREGAYAQDIETLRAGVVKISSLSEGKRKTGAGFIVKLEPNIAYIVTAAHVVEGDAAPQVEFFTRQNVSVKAEVRKIEGGDLQGLALVVVRGQENLPPGLVSLPLAVSLQLKSGGDQVSAIGFPGGVASWGVLRVNVVSLEGRNIVLSKDLEEGNSGGPVIKDNQVVGLIMGLNQGFGLAVPASIVRTVLTNWGVTLASRPSAGPTFWPSWEQSTKDFTSAVIEGVRTVAGVNADIARQLDIVSESKPVFSDTAKRYASVVQAMRGRANVYEQLFGAITDYSASLAAIARAGENSQQAVDAVAGSLNQFVATVGGTSLAGDRFDLGKTLANEVSKINAARDFGEAVRKADPVIGQISDLLIGDLADLQRTVGVTKDEVIRAAFQEPAQKQLYYRAALERRREELQAAIGRTVAPKRTTPEEPVPPTTSLLNVNEAAELAKVEGSLRDTDTWYRPIQDALDRALAVRAKSEELVIQTSRAVAAWRASHASLAAAAEERRLPESGRLAAVTVHIRDLVADIKRGK